MVKRVIPFVIACWLMICGCQMPGEPALRIAIARTAGASIFYVAQEKGLFEKYGVEVELVELNQGCEAWAVFMDKQVDATIVSYGEFVHSEYPTTGTGILMLLAVSASNDSGAKARWCGQCWHESGTEVLIGNRSELMQHRQEWQRVLTAYEHGRLLLSADRAECARIIALRELRDAEEVENDLSNWAMLSIVSQDSLLGNNGPYSHMNALWQGRQFLTSAVSSQLRSVSRGTMTGNAGDEVK